MHKAATVILAITDPLPTGPKSMPLIERYILRRTTQVFLLTLGALVAVLWVTQVLKELDVVTAKGQAISVFLLMTLFGAAGARAGRRADRLSRRRRRDAEQPQHRRRAAGHPRGRGSRRNR